MVVGGDGEVKLRPGASALPVGWRVVAGATAWGCGLFRFGCAGRRGNADTLIADQCGNMGIGRINFAGIGDPTPRKSDTRKGVSSWLE